MRCGDDVLVVDERAAAERLGVELSRAVAERQAHLPRVLVLLGRIAAGDSRRFRDGVGQAARAVFDYSPVDAYSL